MEEQREHKQQKMKKYMKVIMISVLIILVIIICFNVYHFLRKGPARDVLSHAKSVRLATQITYYDYYASKKPFFEDTSTGLRKGGEKEILELAQCKGKILHVEFNEDSFRVSKLTYMEKDYIVEFADSEDEPQWTVYRLEKIID